MNIEVISISGEYVHRRCADTIQGALIIDYICGWYPHNIKSDISYEGKLLKRLDNDCSFEEEIAYLEMQISKINRGI